MRYPLIEWGGYRDSISIAKILTCVGDGYAVAVSLPQYGLSFVRAVTPGP